jgi:nitrogenase subunit NifH
MPITTYAPESGACRDYRLLAEEIQERQEFVEPPPRLESRWRHLFNRTTQFATLKRREG